MALFSKLNNLTNSSLLYQIVLGYLYPQFFPLILILRLVSVLLGQFFLVVLESQCHGLAVEVHFPIYDDLGVDHLVVLEETQPKIKVEIEPTFLHELDEVRKLLFG